jgi:hypothetical protein
MTTQRGIRGVARAAGILAPTNGLTVSSRRQTSGPLPKFIPPPRETAPDVGNSPGAAVSGWTSKGVNAGALGSAAFESQSLDLGTESPVDEGSLCVGALAEGPVISVCLSDRIGPAGMATWQGLLFSASDGRLGKQDALESVGAGPLIKYGGATHRYRDLRNGLRRIFVGSHCTKIGKDWCWFFL